MYRWAQIATTLADAARQLLDHPSVDSILDRVVFLAVDVVEGCAAASVTEFRQGDVRTIAATGPPAGAADRIHAELGDGPAHAAVADGARTYRMPDAGRWPDLAGKLHVLRFASLLGFVLHATSRDSFGVLRLYGAEPEAFGEQAEWVGPILASHSAIALSATLQGEALQRALQNSRSIGIAVGVLMNRYRITEDEAFGLAVALLPGPQHPGQGPRARGRAHRRPPPARPTA